MPVVTRSQAAIIRSVQLNSASEEEQPRLLRSGRAVENSTLPKAHTRTHNRASKSNRQRSTSPNKHDNQPRRKRVRVQADTENLQATASSLQSMDAKRATLTNLPLDIIYEILEELIPLALTNLSQTNRAFRTILLVSPQGCRIWKMVTEPIGIPECPPDVPRVFWTRAFNPGTRPNCGHCGKVGHYYLDYALIRAFCEECIKSELKTHQELARDFSAIKDGILELVVHTYHEATRGRKSYWRPDVVTMAETCYNYRKDINSRKRGAKQAFEKFKREQIQHVRARTEHAQKCRDWERIRWEELEGARKRQNGDFAQRCRALGYDGEDIAAVMPLMPPRSRCLDAKTIEYLWQYCDLKSRMMVIWKHVRPAIEPYITEQQSYHLEAEYNNIIMERTALVTKVYDDYKRTLRPVEWLRLPPPIFLFTTPTFWSLIYDNLDTQLQRSQCDIAALELPGIISAYQRNVKATLLRAMGQLEAVNPNGGASAGGLPGQRTEELDSRVLLASSTFTFIMDHDVGGLESCCALEDVLARLSVSPSFFLNRYSLCKMFWLRLQDPEQHRYADRQIKWDRKGHQIIKGIATALGLKLIPHALRSNHPSYERMSWRKVVYHFLCDYHLSSTTVRIGILSEEASVALRKTYDEYDWLARPGRHWSCNHCSVYLGQLQTCAVIAQHLSEAHAITEPRNWVDLFVAEPRAYYLGNPIYIPVDTPHEVITIECAAAIPYMY
ncbi:uncharacterized protein B0H18DRAFT_1016362 [Fomitopsis serialis]|uniref:uncharacterized protein n=1 Tax=Fomitopsis serialis TaxID=139415 RepID=UPI0020084F26|nr:uncharacterized protein B0H18DRAFT_1016362 [Neoantrodia serialis]KAH9922959.1 hypothetical protein B0H18DRAFT_1016362 [Neoantrodia serialis]